MANFGVLEAVTDLELQFVSLPGGKRRRSIRKTRLELNIYMLLNYSLPHDT